jgi:hypothetical protein
VIAEFGTSTELSSCSVTMVTVAVMSGSMRASVGSTEISTLYVTTFEVVVPAGSMLATVPLNVRPGYAVNVKFTFCPGCTLPMSASLTEALICGVVRSVRVANAPLALLEEEDDEDDEVELEEPTGPPPIH